MCCRRPLEVATVCVSGYLPFESAFSVQNASTAVGGDRDLPSLTLALSEVVVAGADLDRGAPGPSLVVAVCDVELHVAETRARVAEHRPKDMNPTEPAARGTAIDRDPLVVIERRLVVGRGRFDRVRPARAVVIAPRHGDLLAADRVPEGIGEA